MAKQGLEMAPSNSSSNAERAARIMLVLGDAGVDGCSLAALAQTLGEAKSPVHRALTALSTFGFVEQADRRGQYRLGPAIYALANRTLSAAETVPMFRPALVRVSAETGHTSYLMARSGLDSVCLDFQIGSSPVQPLLDGVGGRLPLGVGLGGVSILAGLDDKTGETILSLNEPLYGRWGIERSVIEADIRLARTQGFVVSARPATPGVVTLSLPVPQRRGVQAAVSVMMMADEANDERVALVRAAIERALSLID